MSEDVVFNARQIVKALNEIDPDLKKLMVREMKAIAKPTVTQIKSVIPTSAPLSGMSKTSSRLNWEAGRWKNGTIAPNNVIPRFRTSRSRRAKITSLVAIWLRSPMPAIVGVAGKGPGSPRYATTKEYEWRGTTRRHANRGQGQALIRGVQNANLNNFFYREADKSMPSVEREIKLIWERYSSMVTRKFK
jgi:hypothetical protein